MNSGMAAGLIGPEETDPKAALVTFSKSAINTFRCCNQYPSSSVLYPCVYVKIIESAIDLV